MPDYCNPIQWWCAVIWTPDEQGYYLFLTLSNKMQKEQVLISDLYLK